MTQGRPKTWRPRSAGRLALLRRAVGHGRRDGVIQDPGDDIISVTILSSRPNQYIGSNMAWTSPNSRVRR